MLVGGRHHWGTEVQEDDKDLSGFLEKSGGMPNSGNVGTVGHTPANRIEGDNGVKQRVEEKRGVRGRVGGGILEPQGFNGLKIVGGLVERFAQHRKHEPQDLDAVAVKDQSLVLVHRIQQVNICGLV